MNVKRSDMRPEPFGLKAEKVEVDPNVVGEPIPLPKSIRTPDDNRLNAKSVEPIDYSKVHSSVVETIQTAGTALVDEARTKPMPKPLPPYEQRLINPYEVSITSEKGSFKHRIETAHDVAILMQYLLPMNQLELPESRIA